MTTAARDCLSDLPLEIARHIFCFFGYSELLPVLWTCRSWRQIAIDCREYWFTIILDTPTEGGAQTFISRLRGSKGRPCVVSTATPGHWATLSSTIFPELGANVGTLAFLGIAAHISYMDHVFQVLDSPAPILAGLLVWFCGDPENSLGATLPRSLLQGQAPFLRMVYLINVDIPNCSTAVFGSVTDVAFGYELPGAEMKAVPDLWSLFPCMRALGVMKNAVLGDVALHVHLWRRLEWLHQ